METEILNIQRNKLIKCIKYRDYTSSIYISTYLATYNPEFNILTAILLYEKMEYSRALSYLGTENEITRVYYRALIYKARREYKKALECLANIIEGCVITENIKDIFIRQYCCSINDMEYYECLMGEILVLNGQAVSGIAQFRKSFFKQPLLPSCFGLIDENIYINPINDHCSDAIAILYYDIFTVNAQNETFCEIPENIEQLVTSFSKVQMYMSNSPGYGSYFLAKVASLFCRYTNSNVGSEIFRFLRNVDKYYVSELDTYSTTLWVSKERNLLGLLSRELVDSMPNHHITWIVLANYYSLEGNTHDSIMCLMKSLNYLETAYTYTLLGLEYLEQMRCVEAAGFFKTSLTMLENNDRGLFGMGMAMKETQKKNSAESYFNKALQLNPRNLNMRAMIIKFYVQYRHNELSLKKIREFLGTELGSYEELACYIKSKAGYFKEMEELVILEFSELLVRAGKRNLAKEVLGCVECRTKTYYSKRALIETSE